MRTAAAATGPLPAPPGTRRRPPQHRQDAQREGQQQGDAIEQAPPRGTRLAREQPVQAAQQQEPGQEQQQRQPGHCRLHVIAPEARGHHAMGAVPR
ncbi:hypothetical protein G6F62_014969 [Rhizopus arrhizus]|nr:hypothetical protein G6F68_019346 [Rhizopus microsporus]KAG1308710.1 hypothetical protein G6F62_014969 [Rhizopus arrhizus]